MQELRCEDEEYSALRHLASILSPSLESSGEVLLVMLTAAFDAGGTEDTPFLTVAGFVSSVNDWDQFASAWKQRLNREGIEYFRAVEAAHFRKQFESRHDDPNREQWRRQLFADLMDIVKRHIYRKFGCTIINKNLQKMDSALRDKYLFRAYSLAGRTCDKQVRDWALENRITSPIELVFEAGDEGDTELRLRLARDTGRIPIFRPKKDTVHPDGRKEYGFVPLQAADWLAYELSAVAGDSEESERKGQSFTVADMRWPMQEFNRIPGEPGVYTEEDMDRLEQMIKLSVRIDEWARGLGT